VAEAVAGVAVRTVAAVAAVAVAAAVVVRTAKLQFQVRSN